MKRLLSLAVLAAGLTGCSSSTTEPRAAAEPPRADPPPRPVYASLTEEQQLQRLTEELLAIGKALQQYGRDHAGQLPPKLSHLIAQGYLPANGLVSSADPSGGREGGVPDAYSEWGQAKETDEPGSSYLYEFSDIPCQWDWKGYLGGSPSVADIDTNKDGIVTWAEVKTWHLQHGDTVRTPTRPYEKSQFPLVRCYWYRYPDAYSDIAIQSTVNLAVDLQTVFLAQPWWEKDAK